MSEIMALRTLILDNINTLYSNFDTNSRFVLTCSMNECREQWTVVLGQPIQEHYSHVYEHGKGETPEAAYRDLLRRTDLELDVSGYSWAW